MLTTSGPAKRPAGRARPRSCETSARCGLRRCAAPAGPPRSGAASNVNEQPSRKPTKSSRHSDRTSVGSIVVGDAVAKDAIARHVGPQVGPRRGGRAPNCPARCDRPADTACGFSRQNSANSSAYACGTITRFVCTKPGTLPGGRPAKLAATDRGSQFGGVREVHRYRAHRVTISFAFVDDPSSLCLRSAASVPIGTHRHVDLQAPSRTRNSSATRSGWFSRSSISTSSTSIAPRERAVTRYSTTSGKPRTI